MRDTDTMATARGVSRSGGAVPITIERAGQISAAAGRSEWRAATPDAREKPLRTERWLRAALAHTDKPPAKVRGRQKRQPKGARP